ncbi:MAG TPA: deoxyribose-phosphate aldolase [Pseudogracilibacillus sp.]|nr:deoxyribose-phosphate aldolase [Pseudogracilibacillus sp.]
MNKSSIASYIDHTLLKPESTQDEIITLCDEAKEYKFKTVCINPYWVKIAKARLEDSDVGITTVIGFPLGASTTASKVFETKEAIASGATEIDMVVNVGELKAHNNEAVKSDIKAVVEAAEAQAIVKVIIETGLLTNEEKIRACELSKEAGADFVKTSTGFSKGGAAEADIKLMRETVGPKLGVKASGGVRSLETAKVLIKAGATRLGASSGIAIVKGEEGKGY